MSSCQEGCRKDVERAFGVLQAKWHILVRPSRFWKKSAMREIFLCCVVLHNMMVEYRDTEEDNDWPVTAGGTVVVSEGIKPMWATEITSEEALPPPGSIGAICALQKFT